MAMARSALSAILQPEQGIYFGKHPDVKRVMKGSFRNRPSLPKHTVTFNPDVILDYINSLPENLHLLLDTLTFKLCTLFAILTGQRSQSLAHVNINYIHKSADQYTIYFPTILKNSRPGHHQKPLELIPYRLNAKLSIIACLDDYLTRTKLIRENLPPEANPTALVLSYGYPHHAVTSTTIARYVKCFMANAGIDLTQFSAHATRSASTSKAKTLGMSLKDICAGAGWKSDSTFRKFYNLPVKRQNIGDVILDSRANENK